MAVWINSMCTYISAQTPCCQQRRRIVQATADGDAMALATTFGSTQLPMELAMSVAWRRNLSLDKVGVRMGGNGGLLSADCLRWYVVGARSGGYDASVGDNAATLISGLNGKLSGPAGPVAVKGTKSCKASRLGMRILVLVQCEPVQFYY
jgi:hypothetical protein